MDRFLKKRKLTNDSYVSVNNKNLNIEINTKQSPLISDKRLNLKCKRKYFDNYLCFGFMWNGDIDCPLPVCIVSTVSPLKEELCKNHQSQISHYIFILCIHIYILHYNLFKCAMEIFKIIEYDIK
jgi:hypothetical protein